MEIFELSTHEMDIIVVGLIGKVRCFVCYKIMQRLRDSRIEVSKVEMFVLCFKDVHTNKI